MRGKVTYLKTLLMDLDNANHKPIDAGLMLSQPISTNLDQTSV